jgi:hypothetical protein
MTTGELVNSRVRPHVRLNRLRGSNEDCACTAEVRAQQRCAAQPRLRLDGCGDLAVRSASVDDWKAKARAERLAIFVGLWPPTFFLLGKVMQDLEASPAQQVLRARGVEESQLDDALRHEAAAVSSPS